MYDIIEKYITIYNPINHYYIKFDNDTINNICRYVNIKSTTRKVDLNDTESITTIEALK